MSMGGPLVEEVNPTPVYALTTEAFDEAITITIAITIIITLLLRPIVQK